MHELCECQRLAPKRRCDNCGKPLCEQCFCRSGACAACIIKLNASTDESDASELEAWLKEQA